MRIIDDAANFCGSSLLNIESSLDCDFADDIRSKKAIRENTTLVLADDTKNTPIISTTFLILCS
jgi:hypothetical protein